MEIPLIFTDCRIKILKMKILPKAIYRFNAVPNKYPQYLSQKQKKAFLRTRKYLIILSKKNNTRRITVPALRHKVVMIKTAWNWQKNSHVDQWNRIKDPNLSL